MLGEVLDALMHEYGGLNLDGAIDVTDEQAAILLSSANKRNYIIQENQAILFQIKIGELFTGKKADMKRPYDIEDKDVTTPLSEASLDSLMKTQGGR